jgi:hypothetical protein
MYVSSPILSLTLHTEINTAQFMLSSLAITLGIFGGASALAYIRPNAPR